MPNMKHPGFNTYVSPFGLFYDTPYDGFHISAAEMREEIARSQRRADVLKASDKYEAARKAYDEETKTIGVSVIARDDAKKALDVATKTHADNCAAREKLISTIDAARVELLKIAGGAA